MITRYFDPRAQGTGLRAQKAGPRRVIGIVIVLAAATAMADEAPPGALEPLAALAGHCWVAPLGEKLRDIQCYRWAYNRQFLVTEHMVQGSDPRYEGTTWYGWDGRAQRIVFHYYTSTGAISSGYLLPQDSDWEIVEEHVGSAGDITQVRSRLTLVDAHHYAVQSQHDAGAGAGPPSKANYRRMDAAASNQPGIHVEVDGQAWTLAWNAHLEERWQVMRIGADGRNQALPGATASDWLWNLDGRALLLLSQQPNAPEPGWRPFRVEDWSSGVRTALSEQRVGDGSYSCRQDGCVILRRQPEGNRMWFVPRDSQQPPHWLDLGAGDHADPVWSPDLSQLLVRSNRGGSWELWLSAADGSNARPLTADPANDGIAAHHYGGEGPARFSPDGKQIAWTRRFPEGGFDVWIMNSDGSEARNVTADHAGDDSYPAFSPDGAMLAFNSDRDGNDEIYLMGVDGSGLQRITHRPDYDLAPLWVPLD